MNSLLKRNNSLILLKVHVVTNSISNSNYLQKFFEKICHYEKMLSHAKNEKWKLELEWDAIHLSDKANIKQR